MADNPLNPADVDAVLDGVTPPDRPDLARLAEVASVLRRSVAAEPVPRMSDELQALLNGTEDVVIDLRERSRRKAITGGALAVALFLGATGVAAANDALPSVVQNVVADMGNVVGLDLPDDRGHAGEDPQPEHGNDVKGHDPQGPKEGKSGATPADPGERGGGATPATPPVSTNRPDDAGTSQQPDDRGQPTDVGQPDDVGKSDDAGANGGGGRP